MKDEKLLTGLPQSKLQFHAANVKKIPEMRFIPVFAGQPPGDLAKFLELPDLETKIQTANRSGLFTGKMNEYLSLISEGVILGGLGQKENFHPDRLATLMRSFGARVLSLKVSEVHVVISDEIATVVENFAQLTSEPGQSGFHPVPSTDSADEEEVAPDYFAPVDLFEIISQSVTNLMIGADSQAILKTKKKEKTKEKEEKNIGILCSLSIRDTTAAVERGYTVGRFLNGARTLSSLPGNFMNPEQFEDYAKKISREFGLKCKVFDAKKLESMGCGGILSVGRGSTVPPRMLVIEYRPSRTTSNEKVALIGKGITFDTGGISLKPPSEMHEMKYDMSGASLVLHSLALASCRRLPVEVTGFIGLAENMPDGNAIKPGDVYRAYNGVTVEVQNTDAEGRLVLGDLLSYASQEYKPKIMIDFATLTGACVVALGHEASAIMTASDELATKLDQASRKSLDRMWRMPHWFHYGMGLKSDISDIRNVAGREGGTLIAYRFLSSFVDRKIKWAHIDIAGSAYRSKGTGGQSKGATGWGIRMIHQFLEDTGIVRG